MYLRAFKRFLKSSLILLSILRLCTRAFVSLLKCMCVLLSDRLKVFGKRMPHGEFGDKG